jgi:hypothetical protein
MASPTAAYTLGHSTEDDGAPLRITASGGEPCQGALEAHRLGQGQPIRQRGVSVRVGLTPNPPERGPADGGVESDDRPQADGRVLENDQTLVVGTRTLAFEQHSRSHSAEQSNLLR